MKGMMMARLAAVAGVLAGAASIGGGLYAHAKHPVFGIPELFGVHSSYLSGVHMLVGMGVVMVVGGLAAFRRPALGCVLVCGAAMAGLIYAYERGQYRWTPMLYYWAAPWVFAWISGIFAGYAVYQRTAQVGLPPEPGSMVPAVPAPPPVPTAGGVV